MSWVIVAADICVNIYRWEEIKYDEFKLMPQMYTAK